MLSDKTKIQKNKETSFFFHFLNAYFISYILLIPTFPLPQRGLVPTLLNFLYQVECL